MTMKADQRSIDLIANLTGTSATPERAVETAKPQVRVAPHVKLELSDSMSRGEVLDTLSRVRLSLNEVLENDDDFAVGSYLLDSLLDLVGGDQ